MPPKRTPNTTLSNSTEPRRRLGRTSAYHPGFEGNLIDHGVYPDGYRHRDDQRVLKPENWEEVQQMMTRRRPSLSPSRFSDAAFERCVGKIKQVLDEADVMTNAFPLVRGDSNIPSGTNRKFNNLCPLTDGAIVDGQPGWYDGARPERLDLRVRNELSSYIVPSVNKKAPIVPNFFTEWKCPEGSPAVAGRQTCYDGALGARGMQHLQSYGEPAPAFDNNAYTISSTFDGKLLFMYTIHPTAPTGPGGQPEYHMNELKGWVMTNNSEDFRQGATAYRNARDWTKMKRDEFIEAANHRAKTLHQDKTLDSSSYSDPSTSTQRVIAPDTETSAVDHALDHSTVRPQSSKRVKRRGTRKA